MKKIEKNTANTTLYNRSERILIDSFIFKNT